MMIYLLQLLRLFLLLGCIFYASSMMAAANDNLISLEAEMLKYIHTNDRESFTRSAEKLKNASKDEGDERMFYKAWSNQAVYESTHQFYDNASDIVNKMMEYAREDGSLYGEYVAMHTRGMVLSHQQDYDAAQKSFLDAIQFHHRHYPNESAAEDYRELMLVAYTKGDVEMAKHYGKQLLEEPNVSPHHRGRALYRLCIMAFDENDVEEYNRLYEEMNRLTQATGVKLNNLFTELNYYIINNDYKHALLLVDRLSPDSCAERKALIYHRLGNDEKAYEYMVLYKHLSDSIERVSRDREIGSLYLRMNNDRLRLESELLTHQNSQLRNRFYMAVGAIIILVLLYIIYKRHKIVMLLKRDKTMLEYGKKGAERSLKELNQLSFYESKNELPLMLVNINKLCDHLTEVTQHHCRKRVTAVFLTDFPDDFKIKSNADALQKLLLLLLNDSAIFTIKGMVILKCEDAGDFVRFSVTDTGGELGDKSKTQFSDVFSEGSNAERYVGMNFNICQSIARLLHGRIWRDVEYTDGTRFVFEVPKEV